MIDDEARVKIEQHIEHMQAAGQPVTRMARDESGGHGYFVMPALIEIDSIDRLQREVFGPVLHVLRYRREQLGEVLDALNATGYGLTFGVHSRIDETIAHVTQKVQAGNIYVNRNVIGAVVGVQPFGGMGLSGTGPKAGGPLYLYRLLQAGKAQSNQALTALSNMPRTTTQGAYTQANPVAQATVLALQSLTAALHGPAFSTLAGWQAGDTAEAIAACESYGALRVLGQLFTLPGPTGEANRYQLLPRGIVYALPNTPLGLIHQVAAALASGNTCWLKEPSANSVLSGVLAALPTEVQQCIQLHDDEQLMHEASLGALLFEGDGDTLQILSAHIAQWPGAILRIESLTPTQLSEGARYDLSALMHEQSISTNTAAAGGNAQLMTMG